MKIDDIHKWRVEHICRFKTCQEVGQELNVKALSHHLKADGVLA